MIKFRARKAHNIWSVEFNQDDGVSNDWYDLFENPSELVCEKIATMLNEADLSIEDVSDLEHYNKK